MITKYMRKPLLLFIGVAILLLAAFFSFTHVSQLINPALKYSSTNTPNNVLLKENYEYAEAKRLTKAGEYRKAEEMYEAALLKAEDFVQTGQIKFGIAQTRDYQGDFVGAVRLFKELVDDTNNIPLLRAYAVQWMADINGTYLEPAVSQEIFSTSPYAEMVVPDDTSLTNRHLAEYASSIYPLGFTEMLVALWYAGELTASPNAPEAQSYISIINQKIENAEKDMERTKNDPAESGSIPDILQFEARVKGSLAIAGAGSGVDAEATFERAFTAMATYGMPPWYDEFARLRYAIFLMRMYGKGRTADIHAAIAPLYENPIYKDAPIMLYLKNLRSLDHPYTAQLGNLDAGFKKLLISLGWTVSDFK